MDLVGHPPLMYRPAGLAGAPSPVPGLEVRRVRSAADLAGFEATLVAAYPLPAGSAVVSAGVLNGPLNAWVGYLDGEPVATAGSHTAFGLTEVEWVSTLAGHRRRGVGAALTWAATTAEPGVPAVLIATDDGRPVYERLGYVALQRLSMWLSR
jgi:GNAT superfamily N-acetyltransferase